MKGANYSIVKVIFKNMCEYFYKAPFWGLLEQVTNLCRALNYLLSIVVTQQLFESITSKNSLHAIVNNFLLLIVSLISQQLVNGLNEYLLSKVSYSNMGKFMLDFQSKLSECPAEYFEDVQFLNDIETVKECLEYEKLGHFASISLKIFTYYVPYFILMGGYLFYLSPILPSVILVAFMPSMISQVFRLKYFVNLEEQNAPLRRKRDYYKNAIVDRVFFKETRLLGGFKFFNNLYKNALYKVTEQTWKLEKKVFYIQVVLTIISFVGLFIAIYILFIALVNGEIDVAIFTTVLVSLTQIFDIVDEIVTIHLSKGSELVGQVKNYYELMALKIVDGKMTSLDLNEGIVVKNLNFNYPRQKN